MLQNRPFTELDKSVWELWNETDTRKAIDIGIRVSNNVLKTLIPTNTDWQNQLFDGEDALDNVFPSSKLPNQKAETWFVPHPYLGGERIVLEHFHSKDAPFESRFYALNKSSTKARVSAGVHLSKNWEHSELTKNVNYKVGINFFLSGDSKRVLIALSNQDNLRVMELSERLTNTQREIFNKLYGVCEIKTGNTTDDSTQKLIHTTLWDAFALHELNNRFYAGVASHFELLLQHLIGKNGGEKEPEDAKLFVSRLLGRLLFIWFLRKKEIVAESKHYFDTVKDLEGSEYYEKYLKQLFFETLNTPIKDRKAKDNETPYLNGGLFESHKNDWTDEKVSFPQDWFQSLYDHFDQFNFTTDESSPDYEQVAIDPEMLGRVFESLLATQITSTGEQARKAKGTYYTPREIVAYMCKESLRQYLYTGLNNPTFNVGIDSLLDKSDADFETAHTNAKRDLWGNENAEKVSGEVIALLDKIKILDPACGSGAFPMGMVQLLEKVYERLEPRFDRNKTKLTVIQNNIYGVDIEPMAVEIARLRAWLSIIVDEEDPRTIKPLPNLDFKFVCANSLIALEKKQSDVALFEDTSLIDRLLQIIQEYMIIHDPTEKAEKIQEYRDTAKQLTHDAKEYPQMSSRKTQQLLSWDPKKETPSDFFDSAIMFAVKDGFDVVIGNPPYIQLQSSGGNLADQYQNCGFSTFARTGDIYQLFYEQGIKLLHPNGCLCLITSNKWMRAGYGESTRKYLAEKTQPIQVIDFAGQKVFESATVDVNIILLQKTTTSKEATACIIKDDCKGNLTDYFRQHKTAIQFSPSESWVILSPIEQQIKAKIEKVGTPLKDWDISINYGIKTGCNEAFIINRQKRDELIAKDAKSADIICPILRGRDIGRYQSNFADLYLINTHNGIPAKKIPPVDVSKYPAIKHHLDLFWDKISERDDKGITPYNLRSCAYTEDFTRHKIIYPNMTKFMPFVYDDNQYFTNQKCFIMTGKKLGYLTAFLNSSLFKYCFRDNFPELLGGTRELSKIFFDKIPILKVDDSVNDIFIGKITQLQYLKSQRQKTKELEIDIDNNIFDLYNLNEQERNAIGFIEIH